MNHIDTIKLYALRVIGRMNGEPMAHDTLRTSLTIAFQGSTVGDLDAAVRDLEADGYLIGTTVDMVGIVWTLTPKGRLQLSTIRK